MRDVAMERQIIAGLGQRPRRLPSALLYDALGSTLFEAITLLPEYQVTNADFALLEGVVERVATHLEGPFEVVELGPGAGAKAVKVLSALVARQPQVSFVGIDVSATALEACEKAVQAIEGVRFRGVEAAYVEGLRAAPREPKTRRLVLFLGSNLSNFDRPEAARFFSQVRATLQPGDGFLLATDLDKAPSELLPAYDDALGVTAAFDKNVLVRLNREWGAAFPLDAFVHRARWNEAHRRIEMHLEATRAVKTSVLGVEVALGPGETLWTESSHRFSEAELRGWGEAAGFRCAGQWRHDAWAFAHSLFVATGATT